MAKKLNMVTELDEAVMKWLDTHHIRAKDTKYWSGTGAVGDITELTITFYVSDVDELPSIKNVEPPEGWMQGDPWPYS